MILKRKKISRKYAIKLTRIKTNNTSNWCRRCNYFNNLNNEGSKCMWGTTNHKKSIREACLEILPIKIGGELKNYIYIVK